MTRSSARKLERLPLGATPRDGESLPGYLMRLAARAGFVDAARLARLAGALQPGCAFAATDPPGLHALFECGPLAAIRYGPTERFGYRRFLGGALHREIIDISRRRACPSCLAQAAHHRAAWDFVLVTACPDHGVRLLDRCPACGRRFDWTHREVRSCSCGSDIDAMRAEPASAAERSASSDILAIVSGGDRSFLPAVLAKCPGEDLARLAMWLGMFRSGWQGERRTETLVGGGASAVAKVVIAGVQGLRDWPVTFETQLAAEAGMASRRRGRYGARKTLGSLYDWARDLDPGPVKDAVLDVMRLHVGADAFHRSRLLIGDGCRPATTVTLAEARMILGVSHASIRMLLRSGELTCTGDEGRGVPLAIARADVERLAASGVGALTLEEAAGRLGVTPARTRQLVEAGLIEGRKVPFAPWAIRAESVDDLVARLQCRVVSAGSGAGMPLGRALRILGKQGVDFASALAMAADGRTKVCGVDPAATGLQRLLFEVERTVEPPDGSVSAVAENLGVKWQVAAHLVACGLLVPTLEGADRFRATYVSGAELARSRRTSPKALLVAMASEGRTPVTGPSVDGGRQYFYLRAGKV